MSKYAMFAAAVLTACGGSGSTAAAPTSASTTGPAGSSSAPPQATESAAAPTASGAAFTFADFGLAGNAAGGDACKATKVGSKLARIECGSVSITLEMANAMNDSTVDGAKDTATKAWSDAKNFKSQTLPDGWRLTFEASDAGSPPFHEKTYRTIAGKAYECDTSAKTAADRDAAVAICASLKAAPH